MKLTTVTSFALFFGPIALAAQTTVQNQPFYGVAGMEGLESASAPFTYNSTVSIDCPVLFRAQHRADVGLLNVDESRPEAQAQMLRLTLTNRDSRRMVAARVRVHGLSGNARATQTSSKPDVSDATSTINVQLVQGSNSEVWANLRVPGMTAVLSIDLRSVTYADGSTRNFPARSPCHVVPDPKMLVAAH
jgi:hypothetical protein